MRADLHALAKVIRPTTEAEALERMWQYEEATPNEPGFVDAAFDLLDADERERLHRDALVARRDGSVNTNP